MYYKTDRENKIKVDATTIYYTLNHYDKDKDNKLSFMEFLPMVLPLDDTELRSRAAQRATFRVGSNDCLDPEVERALALLLHQEVTLPVSTDRLKTLLAARQDFNLVDAFKAIDAQCERLIGLENLSLYLMKNKVDFEREDVIAFLRRFDADGDCKLSLSEFANAVVPLSHRHCSGIPDLCDGRGKSSAETFSSAGKGQDGSGTGKRRWARGKSTEVKVDSDGKSSASHHKYRTQVRPFLEKANTISYVNASPLKQSHGKSALAKLMKKQAEKEHLLEDMKEHIAVQKDVTIDYLYRMFDGSKGYVTPVNFMEVYNKFRLNPARDDVYSVFNRFDRNLDGKIGYQDICDIFIPRHKEYSAALLNRKQVKVPVSNETLELLKNFMKKLIDVELSNGKWKKELVRANLKKSFDQVDSRRKGFFTIIDVAATITRS